MKARLPDSKYDKTCALNKKTNCRTEKKRLARNNARRRHPPCRANSRTALCINKWLSKFTPKILNSDRSGRRRWMMWLDSLPGSKLTRLPRPHKCNSSWQSCNACSISCAGVRRGIRLKAFISSAYTVSTKLCLCTDSFASAKWWFHNGGPKTVP